jgi:copper chaperone CopZ
MTTTDSHPAGTTSSTSSSSCCCAPAPPTSPTTTLTTTTSTTTTDHHHHYHHPSHCHHPHDDPPDPSSSTDPTRMRHNNNHNHHVNSTSKLSSSRSGHNYGSFHDEEVDNNGRERGGCQEEVGKPAFSSSSCSSSSAHDHSHHHHHHHATTTTTTTTNIRTKGDDEEKQQHPQSPPPPSSSCCSHNHEHHHHHDHHKGEQGNEEQQQPQQQRAAPMLISAVIQDHGTNVVVYDTNGIPRTFHYDDTTKEEEEEANNVTRQKKHTTTTTTTSTTQLCFGSHGADQMMESFLTPCFNTDGSHGTPSEICFCGIDTPHIHAHIRDAKICHADSTSWEILASKVLYPVDHRKNHNNNTTPEKEVLDNRNNPKHEILKINVSESMPKACNSMEILKRMKDHNIGIKSIKKTRLQSIVQHEDHIDYLVRDNITGDLYLEHPCNTCGDNDIHGTFRPVETRRLLWNQNENNTTEKKERNHSVRLQFFEVETKKPFHVMDFLHSIFELNSDRVNTVEQIMMIQPPPSRHPEYYRPPTNTTFLPSSSNPTTIMKSSMSPPSTLSSTGVCVMVRSTLTCSNICCASEIPIIQKTLNKLNGVDKLMVNVTRKLVNVDHDPNIITAQQLMDALNQQRLGATIQRNGGVDPTTTTTKTTVQQPQSSSSSNNNNNNNLAADGKLYSQFYIRGVCCGREKPMIENALIHRMAGIKEITIKAKIVHIDHIPTICNAECINRTLQEHDFKSEIVRDVYATPNNDNNTTLFMNNNIMHVRSIISILEKKTEQVKKVEENSSSNSNNNGTGTVGTEPIEENHDQYNTNVDSIVACLDEYIHKKRIIEYHVNKTNQTVQVVHNPFVISVHSIVTDILKSINNETIIECKVLVDGSNPNLWNFNIPQPNNHDNENEGGEEEEAKNETFIYPKPTVIVSGILWIISMLSYIGGNWYVP